MPADWIKNLSINVGSTRRVIGRIRVLMVLKKYAVGKIQVYKR
jgi:hypothetical protein